MVFITKKSLQMFFYYRNALEIKTMKMNINYANSINAFKIKTMKMNINYANSINLPGVVCMYVCMYVFFTWHPTPRMTWEIVYYFNN